jgi:cold shock CspA family protein
MSILTKPRVTSSESKEAVGKITYLGQGWGFIKSRDLPYERIFFHWEGLNHNECKFTELNKGDEVKFVLIKNERGWRGIKLCKTDSIE